ncbi:MAG TPA: hypothetical protein VHP36_05915 [Chitinispirillaceae bacterium]|nr:hypothetical protein [Chitinispirillaceae bacterium]
MDKSRLILNNCFGKFRYCLTLYYLIIQIVCLINIISSAEELLRDTALIKSYNWMHYLSEETSAKMSFSFDSTGCTIVVQQSGIQEYEAGIGQQVNIQKDKTYIMSMTASSDQSAEVTFCIRQNSAPWFHYASRTIQLAPESKTYTFKWINRGSGAVELRNELFGLQIGRLKGTMHITRFSLIEQDTSAEDINDFECPVEPKWNATTANIQTLPKGFVIYSHSDESGIFISELNKWDPVKLPGEYSNVSLVSLSDDGRWILYCTDNLYLMRIDGKFKTKVPTPGGSTSAGFLRSSPFSTEIFFDSKESEILYAMQVTLSDSSISLGSTRIIAQLGQDYKFEDYYRLNVCKDQIWGAITSIVNGIPKRRSGFITIPESGMGTATSENVFKFKPDNSEEVFGCNHAMSHDGKYCVAVPGTAGETGSYSHCVPASHKGFYVTGFYRWTDPPVDVREQVNRYCYSLNWCPSEYHVGEFNEVDFGNYYFTNDNQFLIGGQTGDRSTRKGLWVINWVNNSWYPLNPNEQTIKVTSCAAYVGDYDSKLLSGIIPGIDSTDTISNDPIGYKILKPFGGERFYPGDQCTVFVTSLVDGNAAIKLLFDKYSFNLLNRSINPKVDSMIIITIPSFFLSRKIVNGVVSTDTIKPYSTECKIAAEHYNINVAKTAYSNGFFTIASNTGIRDRNPNFNSSTKSVMTHTTLSCISKKLLSGTITQIDIFDLMGRSVLRWNISSGKPLPLDFMRKQLRNLDIYVVRYSFLEK